MNVVDSLEILGGIAPKASLVALVGRRQVNRAVSDGVVVAAGAMLLLPAVDQHVRRAHELSGVVSHLSAAQAWGIPVVWPPRKATVTLPRHRTVRRTASDVVIRFADLEADQVVDGRTTPLRTVIDCARHLPFGEALAVADGALRAGLVDHGELVAAAARLRGRGAPQGRAVAAAASGLAANPFESALRAIALDVPLLDVEPQVVIETDECEVRPDLVDRSLRIVIEADSYEFHTTKSAHQDDCVRFTSLGLAGWLVLRFSWEDVMMRPAYVRAALWQAGALRSSGMA